MDEKIRKLKASLDKKSRKNRAFYDALIRTIWCEIRLPIGHPARSVGDEWADIMLPWWNQWDKDMWTTAREQLPPSHIKLLTGWMADRTADYDITEGRRLMHDLFNDCQLCALNSCPSAFQKNTQNVTL